MQPSPRMLSAGFALAALLAPAIQAELSADHMRPTSNVNARSVSLDANQRQALPVDSGFGAGFWVAATDAPGFASAELYDAAGHVRYTLRASLLPAAPGIPGEDEQGGFLGTLSGFDPNGRKTTIAGVAGKWIRHANGMGEFGVDIVMDTGDRDQPTIDVGQIEGALLCEGTIPTPGVDPVDDEPASGGYLCLEWAIERP